MSTRPATSHYCPQLTRYQPTPVASLTRMHRTELDRAIGFELTDHSLIYNDFATHP